MRKVLLSALVLGILPVSSFAQFNKDIEVKAVIKAGCYLSAENLNFGVIMMPIRDQKVQADMTILCSNNTPYTIYPTYGNQNVIAGKTTVQNVKNGSWVVLVDGNRISNDAYDISCYNNGYTSFSFGSDIVAKAYGYTKGVSYDFNSNYNTICSGTTPNSTTLSSRSFGDKPGGKMIGAKGQDFIAYIFEDPKDTSKVWSKGNVYKATGNGQDQKVVFTGKIQKADNKTYHLTNDIYSDNVTLLISY